MLISSLSQPAISVSTKEQLQETAQKIITQLILDPGTPPDWGKTITESNLITFGLAKHGETTRDAYVLDAYKVIALEKEHPYYDSYTNPDKVLRLLNLETEYGFTIEFNPALSVEIVDAYTVTVKSNYGSLPIVGANVTTKMYYIDAQTQQIKSTQQIDTRTDIAGTCTLNFDTSPSQHTLLILVIDYYGTRVIKINSTNINRTYLTENGLLNSSEYSEAMEIMIHKKLLNGTYTNAIENINYTTEKEIEPTTIAIIAISNEGKNPVYASTLPKEPLIYSTIPNITPPPLAYSIERTVTITSATYLMTLTIWKMNW